jgi:hypothetical protein
MLLNELAIGNKLRYLLIVSVRWNIIDIDVTSIDRLLIGNDLIIMLWCGVLGIVPIFVVRFLLLLTQRFDIVVLIGFQLQLAVLILKQIGVIEVMTSRVVVERLLRLDVELH